MNENATIIVPVQFNSDCTWSKFRKSIFCELRNNQKDICRNDKIEILQWKMLKYFVSSEKKTSRKWNSELYVTDNAAFEKKVENIKQEQDFLYREAFRTLYDEEYAASCMFMLTVGKDENVTLLEDLCLGINFGGEVRKIRKAYILLTNVKSCLIVLELCEIEKSADGSNKVNRLEHITDILSKYKQESLTAGLVKWVFGDDLKQREYVLPFGENVYSAVLKQNKSENVSREIPKVQIDSFSMTWERDYEEKAIGTFFGQYFQLYLLCILQKTEMLRLSQKAGDASRKIIVPIMSRLINKISGEYAVFSNQFDFVECSYDKQGTQIYNKLQEEMQIDKARDCVREQIKVLREYATFVSSRLTNILLAVISFIASVVTIVGFCQSICGGN